VLDGGLSNDERIATITRASMSGKADFTLRGRSRPRSDRRMRKKPLRGLLRPHDPVGGRLRRAGGEALGHVDLAAIAIGAYEPRWFSGGRRWGRRPNDRSWCFERATAPEQTSSGTIRSETVVT
jgi:hypothetical protein